MKEKKKKRESRKKIELKKRKTDRQKEEKIENKKGILVDRMTSKSLETIYLLKSDVQEVVVLSKNHPTTV